MINIMKLLGTGMLALALACGSASADETVTFATASNSVAYVTYYITKEMGFFKKVGLAPEMVITGSGARAMAAAVGGDVDVVMPTPAEVMIARKRGIDLVFFGAVATQLGTSIVFSKSWAASHHITEASSLAEREAALKGIRLAISSPGSLTDAVVRYFAREAGLNPDRDLTLVGIPNLSNAMMVAMERGRVDGFVIAPPDTDVAAQELGAVIAFNPAAGDIPSLAGFFYIGLASTEDFVKSEKAEKIARAFQMTLDAIKNPKTSDIVRDKIHALYYPKVSSAVFANVWRNVVSAAPKTLRMNSSMFEKVVKLQKLVTPGFSSEMIKGSYTNVVADKVAP